MKCPCRWRISAILTTASPLHLGGGGFTIRAGLNMANASANRPVRIQAVCTASDAGGERPFIPGNSLKGRLRSWLDENIKDPNIVVDLFGARRQDEDACGGRVVFCDALAVRPKNDGKFAGLPWWDVRRLAAVETNVSIDRRTGTASDKKLFHTEYVPAGVDFDVVVEGESAEESWERDVRVLFSALLQFNGEPGGMSLGANTANGWGRLILKDGMGVELLDRSAVGVWLGRFFSPAPGTTPAMWRQSMKKLDQSDVKRLAGEALQLLKNASNWIEVNVTLQFLGPFLVNDPGKTTETSGDGKPNHAPRMTADGTRVLLPSSGVRGALRAQGERILRTLKADAACRVSKDEDACKPVHSVEDLSGESQPCPACLLFGASGWKSPVEIGDFVSNPIHVWEGLPMQEFVAIDRFTGGALPGAKFNAKYVREPRLTGVIRIDGSRTDDWGWGLLILLARDLMEGDIRFGHGKTKGYGECLAQIAVNGTSLPGNLTGCQKETVLQMVECLRTKLSETDQKEAVSCRS